MHDSVLDAYALLTSQPGLQPDAALFRNMAATFGACGAHDMVCAGGAICLQALELCDAACTPA
jgi:hypothetical protein